MARIIEDVQRGLYDSFHLNFSTHISRPLMEKLAAGAGGAWGSGARQGRHGHAHAGQQARSAAPLALSISLKA